MAIELEIERFTALELDSILDSIPLLFYAFSIILKVKKFIYNLIISLRFSEVVSDQANSIGFMNISTYHRHSNKIMRVE